MILITNLALSTDSIVFLSSSDCAELLNGPPEDTNYTTLHGFESGGGGGGVNTISQGHNCVNGVPKNPGWSF